LTETAPKNPYPVNLHSMHSNFIALNSAWSAGYAARRAGEPRAPGESWGLASASGMSLAVEADTAQERRAWLEGWDAAPAPPPKPAPKPAEAPPAPRLSIRDRAVGALNGWRRLIGSKSPEPAKLRLDDLGHAVLGARIEGRAAMLACALAFARGEPPDPAALIDKDFEQFRGLAARARAANRYRTRASEFVSLKGEKEKADAEVTRTEAALRQARSGSGMDQSRRVSEAETAHMTAVARRSELATKLTEAARASDYLARISDDLARFVERGKFDESCEKNPSILGLIDSDYD